jgi:hypothetical protein
MGDMHNVKMVRREEPEFVRFAAPGTVLEGTLVRIERMKVENGTANKYTVRAGSGKLACFLGTYAIDVLLYVQDVGRLIKVHYVGEDVTNVKQGQNARKIFEIDVADRMVDPSEITDADIPF